VKRHNSRRDLFAAAVFAALMAFATAGAAAQGPPTGFEGFSRNKGQPVKIQAASLEVRDKEKIATFRGDVHVTQGDTLLRCQTLVVYYDADDVTGGSLNFTRQGGVPQTSLKITDINSSSLESFSRDA